MDEGLIKIRHARSKKDFPFLKLEDDEYVVFSFKRAKICLMLMMGTFGFLAIAILISILLVPLIRNTSSVDSMGRNFLYIILFTLLAATVLAAILALRVFRGNRVIITNKHVIQFTMISPVVNSINMIDLSSIEDASFSQGGLIQKILHYGTFRLSTIGDETTYTFPYSDVTASELRAVARLITEAKKKQKDSDD